MRGLIFQEQDPPSNTVSPFWLSDYSEFYLDVDYAPHEFNVVLEQQYRKCADVLAHKKKEYTGDRIDRLSAFKIAASLQGCTPKAALAGMMSKHVVSLYDMCYSSLLQFDLEQWDEKITDCINYLILLKALIKEEQAYGSH